jgi:hypothetical protein
MANRSSVDSPDDLKSLSPAGSSQITAQWAAVRTMDCHQKNKSLNSKIRFENEVDQTFFEKAAF